MHIHVSILPQTPLLLSRLARNIEQNDGLKDGLRRQPRAQILALQLPIMLMILAVKYQSHLLLAHDS